MSPLTVRTSFRWLNWIGHILIKNVEVEISGQCMDKHLYADGFSAWTGDESKAQVRPFVRGEEEYMTTYKNLPPDVLRFKVPHPSTFAAPRAY